MDISSAKHSWIKASFHECMCMYIWNGGLQYVFAFAWCLRPLSRVEGRGGGAGPYPIIPAMTRDLGLHHVIRWAVSFSRLSRPCRSNDNRKSSGLSDKTRKHSMFSSSAGKPRELAIGVPRTYPPDNPDQHGIVSNSIDQHASKLIITYHETPENKIIQSPKINFVYSHHFS